MISFFANKNGSGEIRGRQMAEHLEARLNPTDGYSNDLCIYVKRKPPEDYPRNSYLDILDGSGRLHWLDKHPDIGVIASSLSGHAYLEDRLGRKVVYIPQHHCNIERVPHTKQWPLRLGVVGGTSSMNDDLAKEFNINHWNPGTRLGVVEAYLQIDVQVIWRGLNRPLKNSLKIVNAAAFGIPTIALPEPGYQDVDGYYLPVKDKEQLADTLETLKDGWSQQRLIEKAEEFHIDNVAKFYAGL
jgi:hypothetical protein